MATELERLYVRVVGDIGDLDKKLNRAQKLVSDFSGRVSRVGRALQLGFTVPLGVAAATIVRAGAEMDALRRGLETAVGSAERATRLLTELKEVARLPGLGFRESIQGAIQLNVALEGMNDRVELSNRLLTQFGNAIALTGGGRAELDRVILQLGQMAAAGRVLTADLRPIIQTAPAVATALRRAFGTIDAQQIERLGLTTEEFFHRLLQGLESLPRASRTARSVMEDLSDSVFRLRVAIADQLLPVLEPIIGKLADLAERASEAEGAHLRWVTAIGAALAVVGPLTVAVGALAKVVAALTAGLSTGLIVAIGAVLVGLSGLVTWFVKSRLEAAAMAKQVDEARRAFSEMVAASSRDDLVRELEARQRRLMQLTPELQRLRRSLAAAEQAGAERLAGPIRRQLQPLEREAKELVRQINEIRTQLDTLGTAGGGGGGGGAAAPPVLRLTLDNLRRLDEALQKTRDRLAALRFELAFETQADKAEKLREEIAATEERLRRMEAVARRAGDAFRLLSLPDVDTRLAGEEAFQVRGLPVPAEPVAVAPVPEVPALGAATRALYAFEIGLRDLNTSFREASSVLGRFELVAFSVGRAMREVWDGLRAAGAQVARGFVELFNPLRMGSQALQRSFQEAAKVWEPLDEALAPVVQALGDALRPAVEALAPVFVELGPVVKAIGQILAALLKAVAPILRAVVPILRALFPLIKLAAIGLTYLGQVVSIVGIIFFTVASGIAKAVGSVIEAIGKLIDKLPFVSGKSIINFGRNLKAAGDEYANAADSFKEAFKELGKARDEIRGIELDDALDDALDPVREAAKETGEALRNVPSGFKIALARFTATTGIPVGSGTGATTTAASAGSQVVNDNRTINVTVVSDDPERIWREIQRRAERDGYRMHGTLVPAVG